MPKVKLSKHSPSLDMTPMVDLAFLLVTFFMLTTQFRPDEPVIVDVPSSISEIKLPERDVMIITVSKEGKVFFDLDGKYTREMLIQKIAEKYSLKLTPLEVKNFSVLSGFGMPIGNISQWLNMSKEERDHVDQPGIPCDSARNELADWIVFARISNPKLRIAIKGDQDADYPKVKQVISTLQDKNVNRFNLITNMDASS